MLNYFAMLEETHCGLIVRNNLDSLQGKNQFWKNEQKPEIPT